MATKTSRSETIEPSAIVAEEIANKPENQSPEQGQVNGPHSYDEMVGRMIRTSRLGKAGKDFTSELSSYFAERSPDIKLVKIPYGQIECYAAVHSGYKMAIPLIFNETYFGNQNLIPPTEYVPDVVKAFKEMEGYGNYHIAQYDIVDAASGDYERPDLWGAHCHNVFMALDDAYALTSTQFREMRLSASTDLKQTLNWIGTINPHGIAERADWGVLISRFRHGVSMVGYNPKKDIDAEPILGFTGYTRFISANFNGIKKYIPICVITNITSEIPSVNILNLVLPIAAGTVINQRVWERPYCKFTKGSPNLGMLRLTADMKNVDFFNNIEQMHAEMGSIMIDPPLLAIDCAEGRARIPGLEKMLIFGSDACKTSLEKFYGTSIFPFGIFDNNNSILHVIRNYEGTYKTNGQVVDTRNGDFINMLTDTKDPNRVRSSLQVFPVENRHLQDIASVYGDETVTPLYRVSTIIFNNELINNIAKTMSNIVNYTSEGPMDQSIDISQIIQSLGSVAITGNNSFFGGYSSFNTPANIYN